MAQLLAQVLIWCLALPLAGLWLRAHARRQDVCPSFILATGMALLGAFPLLSLAVLFSRRISPRLPISRLTEQFVIDTLPWVLAALIAWSLSRVLHEFHVTRNIRQRVWDSELASQAGGDDAAREEVRAFFEAQMSDSLDGKAMVLRLTNRTQLPFTIGWRTPEVFLSIWTMAERDGMHVFPLMEHEAEHIRLNHHRIGRFTTWYRCLIPFTAPLIEAMRLAMEVAADRAALRDRPPKYRDAYLDALRDIVQRAWTGGKEPGIGHDRSDIPRRIRQSTNSPASGFRALAPTFALLSLLPAGAAGWYAGPLETKDLVDRYLRKVNPLWGVQAPDEARTKSIPGRGGVLQDGILVDTTHVHDNLVTEITLGVDIFVKEPGKLFVLGYTIMAEPTEGAIAHPFGSLVSQEFAVERIPAGPKSGSSTKIFRLHGRIYDLDLAEVDAARTAQSFRLAVSSYPNPPAMTQMPDWRLAIEAPRIFIPKGWKVRITNVSTGSADGQERPRSVIERQASRMAELKQSSGAKTPLNLYW